VSATEREAKLALALSRFDEGTREEFDERAGIIEFCGGMTREESEREAWRIVVKKK
jgi:hypothetical protein